jgi:hypothetical protein
VFSGVQGLYPAKVSAVGPVRGGLDPALDLTWVKCAALQGSLLSDYISLNLSDMVNDDA